MDRDNKYYEVIENLVKNHKKFNGYEAILDDIIDDVYSHSEVILKTVDNEQVVNAYLEKVVSTSIITLPKKLNFHKEVKHAIINPSSSLLQNLNNNIEQNQDILEEQLNNTDEIALDIEPEQETTDLAEDIQEFTEPVNEAENNTELVLEPEINTEELIVSDTEPAIELQEELSVSEEEPSDFIKVDNDLVDKMINLSDTSVFAETEEQTEVTKDETEEQTFEISDEKDDVLPQDELNVVELEITDNEENVEENIEMADFQELETVNLEQHENNSDGEIEMPYETIENKEFETEERSADYENSFAEIAENTDGLQEFEIENTDFSEPEIDVLEDTGFELDLTQEENFGLENNPELENDYEIQPLEENDDINFEGAELFETADMAEETEPYESISTIDENNSLEISQETDFGETNEIDDFGALEDEHQEESYDFYSQITAEPKCINAEYNQEEILDKISNLAIENSSIDLVQLFELKYNQNKNIDEIASELNCSVDNVTEGLNKLISVL